MDQEKITLGQKIGASFSTRKFKGGAYAVGLSVVLTVIVLIINVIVAKLDITFDLTDTEMYSLTDETVDMIQQIEDDITIYYIAQTGQQTDIISKIVENYPRYADHIDLVYKDPVQYPKFATTYYDGEIYSDSLIVVNETNQKAKYIDYEDMLIQELDYTTYTYNVTGIDVESKVNSALQYVMNPELPVLYETAGHGEMALDVTALDLLTDSNVTVNSLKTLTAAEIPADCDVVMINLPTTDFTIEEVELFKSFIANGGNVVVNLYYESSGLPNLSSFLTAYGITAYEGIVVEGDSDYYRSTYPNVLVPDIKSHEITEAIIGTKSIVVQNATGMSYEEVSGYSYAPLLTTSDAAYSKIDLNSTLERKAEDIGGPFYLSLEVTDDASDGKLLMLSGQFLLDQAFLSNFGNADLLINAINDYTDQQVTVSVRTIDLAEDTIILTTGQARNFGIIIIGLLPLLFVGIGIAVTAVRRRR